MDTQASAGDALARSLATLLDLGRRAREARSEAELSFLLVNDSLALTPYRQAALWWHGRGVATLSGLVQADRNAPYVQWLDRLAQAVADTRPAADPAAPRALVANDLPQAVAAEWSQWWPAHGLWVPLAGGPSDGAGASADGPEAGLLLAGDLAFDETAQALWREWAAAWWHAYTALRATQRRRGLRLWPWAGRSGGLQASERHSRWWRRPGWLLALGLTAAAFVPVRLSVLAPGELVPHQPTVVRAPLDGVIDVFHVRPNQTVRKGQPLFGFDEALIQSRLEVAQQALATATTEKRQAQQQALVDARVRPQLAVLDGRIEERRAEVGYLRDQLRRTRVLSPGEGVALLDDATEWIGRPVSVGERVLRIAAVDDIEVEAWLPIADAIALAPGATIRLYLHADPLRPVDARLRLLAHEAVQRPDGGFAYRIRATLDSPTAHRVGLKGTAKIEGERVIALYWALRRPIATARATLGL